MSRVESTEVLGGFDVWDTNILHARSTQIMLERLRRFGAVHYYCAGLTALGVYRWIPNAFETL